MLSLRFAVAMLAVHLVMCYDEIYDKIDVDKILGDDKMFNSYLACLLDKGPCDLEHSKEFRKLIPEVIAEACAKCSPIQRQHVRKSVKAIQERNPDKFKEFQDKYDPKRDYETEFAAFLVRTD